MPTQEQLWEHVAAFERDYPEALSDRLRWWTSVLGIDPNRLPRLLTLDSTKFGIRSTSEIDWEGLVARRSDQAELIDEMLIQILASHDYDLDSMAKTVRSRPRRSAGDRPASSGLGPKAVLEAVESGEREALTALVAYLGDPDDGPEPS